MLVGEELLAKVAELAGAPKSTLVKECGYIGTRKRKDPVTGESVEKESLMFAEFQDALLKAKGIDLTPARPASDGPGRRGASYRTTVHKSGALVVGGVYLEGFEPGTEFAITVGANVVQLVMVGEDGEPEEPDFGEEAEG